ncbi:hypothetical protein BJ138DRAFT_98498 [Hygrophoropsis aurantiaca]|uniref:Uncharacterized protein n=1 Tax=Hygrophoropsis aurantiaca TaxID=72124 RepID=A0ACB8ABD5_9AGAM|nr:hypothetical protein BJ138DRAFT_98498 [Hygrophoropsis aurantiaca]
MSAFFRSSSTHSKPVDCYELPLDVTDFTASQLNSKSWYSNVHFPKLFSTDTAKEVLGAVLHSILFHCLFGTMKLQTFEVMNVSMVSKWSSSSMIWLMFSGEASRTVRTNEGRLQSRPPKMPQEGMTPSVYGGSFWLA